MEKFRNVGLIGRAGSQEVIDSLIVLKRYLVARGLTVVLEQEMAEVLPEHGLQVSTRECIGEMCDLVIVVGGDGSMLGAARSLARFSVPVLGINRGRLGFLTDILPHELEWKLTEVLDGNYTTERRFLLDTIMYRNGEPIGEGSAFNDVVVSSGEAARMIEFETYINDQFVYSQRSDGLIVSTPTGSTAYSLSGGGPIMHPDLDALVLVPMFPHTLTSRPIVVNGNSEIKIVFGMENQIFPVVTCDGHDKIEAEPGDSVTIKKKPHELTMIHPLDHNFYAICRDKLQWGNRLFE